MVNRLLNFIEKLLNKIPIKKIIWPPRKVGKIPFAQSWFYYSFRLDKSTVQHFIGTFMLAFFFGPLAALLHGEGVEESDGTADDDCIYKHGCKQGYDIGDMLANILGLFPYIWLPTFWQLYGNKIILFFSPYWYLFINFISSYWHLFINFISSYWHLFDFIVQFFTS